jgi:hypothetical protein
MEGAREADQRAGLERPQIERVVVQDTPRLGICGQEDLEAAIQLEAVYVVGPDPSPQAVRGLEQQEVPPRLLEVSRAAQASHSRADDDHVRF